MGNHKFKLSDMMPNAWFYKLKDMSKSTRKKTSLSKNNTNSNSAPTTISPSKYSHYLVPDPETPRFGDPLYSSPFNYPKVSDAYSCTSPAWKSASCTRKTIYKRNDACFTYRSNDGNSDPFYYSVSSSECSPRRPSFELFNADIVIDVDGDHHCCHGQHQESCFGAGKRNASFDKEEMVNDLDDFRPLNMVSERIELPPILTKFPIQDDPTATAALERSKSFRYAEEEEAVLTSMTRESRDQDSLVTKKQKKKKKKKKLQVQGGNERCKRSEWENFAVVKASFDPQRDFKESMREMILENDIRASKDLEELLACYLTLNSDRYHPMIIEAFEDIWIEMFGSSHTGFSSTK